LLEAREHVGKIGRQRIQMAQLHVADVLAARIELLGRPRERAVRTAPADDEHVTFLRAAHLGRRDLARDAGYLAGADAHHLLVVRRRVADVAGDVLLGEAADAVLQTRRAGPHPRARQRLLITDV